MWFLCRTSIAETDQVTERAACVLLAECSESTLIRSGSKQLPTVWAQALKVASAEYFGLAGL